MGGLFDLFLILEAEEVLEESADGAEESAKAGTDAALGIEMNHWSKKRSLPSLLDQ